VWASYGEEERFAAAGGDMSEENMTMDGPGKFSLSDAAALDTTLGFPEAAVDKIDDAASLVHMMNANIFTGAAYRLKDGADMDQFAEEAKANILATQWICGQPDTLLILQVDSKYIITAYGNAEIIELYKNKAVSALKGAKVLMEASIA